MNKPHVIIFSSGKAHPVAAAVKANLEIHGTTADTWKENFFDENNETALHTFLKKLLCYDAAVLVLGDDDVRLDDVELNRTCVPRDNVIFELGAAMARMGTKKTFILTPASPAVTLPTYFKGINPLKYEHRSDRNYVAGTGTACTQIVERLTRLDEDAFHSDLPAVGLAYGYFFNFIQPVVETLVQSQRISFPDGATDWCSEHGFTLTVVIPEMLMNRRSADTFLRVEMHAANVHIQLRNGRDMSIYALNRSRADAPLHILDIPTTLLTSEEVIRRVDNFWGAGDRDFRDRLTQRELMSFGRRIRGLVQERQLAESEGMVVSISQLAAHVSQLS